MENLGYEFEELRDQLSDLITDQGDEDQLKQNLLVACSRLLSIYSYLHARDNGISTHHSQLAESSFTTLADILNSIQSSQAVVREIEQHYKSVLDSESILICQLLPDGTIKFANQSFLRCFTLPASTSSPGNFLHLLGTAERAKWRHKIAAMTPGQPVFSITHAVQLEGGINTWHQWNCSGYFDSQGKLVDIQAVGNDVTALKLAEIAAEQHNRELTALHAANQALLTTLESEALLSKILDAATNAVPAAQKGTLHLIARDTGQLELRASIGYADPRIQKFSYSESSGYVARAVRERQPLIFDDTIGEIPNPRKELIPEVSTNRSAIVAPLILNERVLGALCLESSCLSAFSEADLRLLVSIAVTATNAIYNAELHAEVQKRAITDALTGLYNRRGFIELGEREIERSFRFKHPLTAIMLDVDRMKDINDTYGHFAGDQVLRSVASCCEKQLRKVDIIGRYGGDEFIILLPETHMRLGASVAERIRRHVADTPIPCGTELIQASVSLGIAGLTTEITSLEALIDRADTALYNAKHSGRNHSTSL